MIVKHGNPPAREPGLFFVGLHLLYAFSSEMSHGVGRDAARIAAVVAARASSQVLDADGLIEARATA